jgi:hypothetical protein
VFHLLPARDHQAALLFTDFIIGHLKESNFKSVISVVWSDDLFRQCIKPLSYRTNHRALNFFRLTWTILEQFPVSVQIFYSNQRHLIFWNQLNGRSTNIPELKLFAYTLSIFNREFTKTNRNTTEWFRPKIERLVESYSQFPGFQIRFGWLKYDDDLDVCEDGICRLLHLQT